MSIRAARILQLIAVILLAASLALTLLAIPLQRPLKSLFTSYDEVLRYTSVPVVTIIFISLRLLLAVLYFISLKKRDARPMKAPVIVYAVIYAALMIVMLPLINYIDVLFIRRQGTTALASDSALNTSINMITALPLDASAILMPLSLGYAYGKIRE